MVVELMLLGMMNPHTISLQCMLVYLRLSSVSGIQGYEKYLWRKRKDVEDIRQIRQMAD